MSSLIATRIGHDKEGFNNFRDESGNEIYRKIERQLIKKLLMGKQHRNIESDEAVLDDDLPL